MDFLYIDIKTLKKIMKNRKVGCMLDVISDIRTVLFCPLQLRCQNLTLFYDNVPFNKKRIL